MTTSDSSNEFTQLQEEIEDLKKRADELRRAEKRAVIRDINSKIKDYDIKPYQLKFPIGRGSKSSRRRSKHRYAPPDDSTPILYRSQRGLTWNGIGARPGWVQKLLERGRDLDEYRVK